MSRFKPATLTINYLYVAGLLFCSLTAAAMDFDDLPAYYPEHFNYVGHVDRLDIARRVVVIEDQLIHVPHGTAIFSRHSQNELISSLTPGTRIGYSIQGGGRNAVLLNAAWIIPESLRIPDETRD